MGDTLAQYRACIGSFGGGRSARIRDNREPWPDLSNILCLEEEIRRAATTIQELLNTNR